MLVHQNKMILDRIKQLSRVVEIDIFKDNLTKMTEYYKSIPMYNEFALKDADYRELAYVDVAVGLCLKKVLKGDEYDYHEEIDKREWATTYGTSCWRDIYENLHYDYIKIKDSFKLSNKLTSAYISMTRTEECSLRNELRETLKISIINEINKSSHLLKPIKKWKKNENKLIKHLKQIK